MLHIVSSQKDVKLVDAVLRQVLPYVDTPHRVAPLADGLPELDSGDVLLAMGGTCLDALKQVGAAAKNLGLNALRGKRLPFGRGEAMVTYDPFIVSKDPALMPQSIWDVRLACRIHDTGDPMPKMGKYQWVEDFAEIVAAVEAVYDKTGKPVPLSPDLETIGLDPWAVEDEVEERPAARILTISFTIKEGSSHVYRVPLSGMPSKKVMEQIKFLLTTPKVRSVGANLKFDAVWIKQHWGFWIENQGFDTMLAGSLVDENRSNSLTLHAQIYTPIGGYDLPFNDKTDKSRMDLALDADPDGFLTYAGGDTDACMRCYPRIREQIAKDRQLTAFYTQLLQPAAKVFAKVEHRGVVVDINRYKELEVEVGAEIERLTGEAIECLPRRLRNKYADNLSLGRPALLEDFLFTKNGLNLTPLMKTPSGKAPSTAMEHLQMFSDVPEAANFIGILKDLNGAKKTMSTYIVGFMRHLRSDGRFHPTYMLHRGDYDGSDSGAVTGRTSAKDPAYQTIPKHTKWAKPLRTVYTCPPGHVILKLDFSQGELRVTACVANESNMLRTYKQGIDMHLRTGALVNHITLEEALALKKSKDPNDIAFIKKVRQGGKAGNFGLIYGMSAAGFQNYAWTAYKVRLTLAEAEIFRAAFFDEYPGLIDWHNHYKKLAHLHGAVRSPLGRIRHLPLINDRDHGTRAEAERQSINSPIQSCLSDMMQLAMVELDRAYPDLWMFGMTHDDLGMYVPQGEVVEWATRVRDVMQDLPLHKFGWEPQLSFIVDAETSSTNLAECEELALAA